MWLILYICRSTWTTEVLTQRAVKSLISLGLNSAWNHLSSANVVSITELSHHLANIWCFGVFKCFSLTNMLLLYFPFWEFLMSLNISWKILATGTLLLYSLFTSLYWCCLQTSAVSEFSFSFSNIFTKCEISLQLLF